MSFRQHGDETTLVRGNLKPLSAQNIYAVASFQNVRIISQNMNLVIAGYCKPYFGVRYKSKFKAASIFLLILMLGKPWFVCIRENSII